MDKVIVKRVVSYFILTTLVGVSTYFLHNLIEFDQPGEIKFLYSVYTYFYIFSLITYLIMEVIYSFLPNSTGLIFLASVFVKLGFFTLMYKSIIFSEKALIMADKLAIIIPFIVFLLLEVVGLIRLLNSADQQAE